MRFELDLTRPFSNAPSPIPTPCLQLQCPVSNAYAEWLLAQCPSSTPSRVVIGPATRLLDAHWDAVRLRRIRAAGKSTARSQPIGLSSALTLRSSPARRRQRAQQAAARSRCPSMQARCAKDRRVPVPLANPVVFALVSSGDLPYRGTKASWIRIAKLRFPFHQTLVPDYAVNRSFQTH